MIMTSFFYSLQKVRVVCHLHVIPWAYIVKRCLRSRDITVRGGWPHQFVIWISPRMIRSIFFFFNIHSLPVVAPPARSLLTLGWWDKAGIFGYHHRRMRLLTPLLNDGGPIFGELSMWLAIKLFPFRITCLFVFLKL